MTETRIFFGTLEYKALYEAIVSTEQAIVQARKSLKLGDDWVWERSIAESKKTPRTVIAKWNREKPIRQALPPGITSFIATHVESGKKVGTLRIKCKGNETPDQQVELVTKAFTKPMEISEWQYEDEDHEVHLQCTRVAFTPIQFRLGNKTANFW
jgi:hypothetical protein